MSVIDACKNLIIWRLFIGRTRIRRKTRYVIKYSYANPLPGQGFIIKKASQIPLWQSCGVRNDQRIFNKKGSITVEASIVITTLILVIYLIIYGCLIMFHHSFLQSTVSKAARLGAAAWVDVRMDIETGKIDYGIEKDSIYNDIFFDGSTVYHEILHLGEENPVNGAGSSNARIDKIRQVVIKGLSGSIIKPVSADLEICFTNNLIQRQLKVTITQEVKVPFGFIKGLFTDCETVKISATGVSTVSDPAEYIRNIDLAVEYFHKFGRQLNIEEKIKELKEKLMP